MTDSAFERLVGIISQLRDPETGCPWDRTQDHRSLRPYLLEEAYETLAAIDDGAGEPLAEELGDVLLQVLLHSQIAAERGTFTIGDVLDILTQKLIRRHPHVFGDASRDLRDVKARWNEIKKAEGKTGSVPAAALLLDARKAAAAVREHSALGLGDTPLTADERAGAALLELIGELWADGHDPELALRAILRRLDRANHRLEE